MGDESMGFGVPPLTSPWCGGGLPMGYSPRLGVSDLESSNSCSPCYIKGVPSRVRASYDG